ncbi:hypothetical protein FACS1894120_4380 [Clostridia bacterium]|nr:hypothetical protein FACS1894120_4380 [Clostridia bacterium]
MGTEPNKKTEYIVKLTAIIYAALFWSFGVPWVKMIATFLIGYTSYVVYIFNLSTITYGSIFGLILFVIFAGTVFFFNVLKISFKNIVLLLALWVVPPFFVPFDINFTVIFAHEIHYNITAWIYWFVILAALIVQLHKHGRLREHRKLLIFYVSSAIPAIVFGMGEPFYPI